MLYRRTTRIALVLALAVTAPRPAGAADDRTSFLLRSSIIALAVR
jgi:hypothetical protein